MARASTCGSLVALRHRLSPGLPFRAPLDEGVRIILPNTLSEQPKNKRAASVDPYGSCRWRPGGLGNGVAVVPWLCVIAFRRFCSEQRVRVSAFPAPCLNAHR